MIDVMCHSNLNLHIERWPNRLACLPHVGDEIVSAMRHGHFQLSLQVVKIRFEYSSSHGDWIPHIELHMTDFQRRMPSKSGQGAAGSITAFYEWYAPLVGKSVSWFI